MKEQVFRMCTKRVSWNNLWLTKSHSNSHTWNYRFAFLRRLHKNVREKNVACLNKEKRKEGRGEGSWHKCQFLKLIYTITNEGKSWLLLYLLKVKKLSNLLNWLGCQWLDIYKVKTTYYVKIWTKNRNNLRYLVTIKRSNVHV